MILANIIYKKQRKKMELLSLLALNCLSLSSEAEKIASSSHKQTNLLCP